MRIRYHRGVGDDFRAMRVYGVDRWGVNRTRDFLAGIEEAIQRLRDAPRMGRRREAFASGLRSIFHRGYHIFYAIDAGQILIVAVIHERRDMAAFDFAERLSEG